MAQQTINVGVAPNDGTGDPLQTAFTKSNANFTELYARPSVAECGRLEYVSATALSFKPYNGDRIKINGVPYVIPSAGIVGLANTNIFKEGVAAQNLTASSTYLVFAFINSGTVTADFRLMPTATHAPSATAGNVGVEILTGNDTRTLIGMCRINASSQFQNDAANRFVISWFNRRNIALQGAALSNVTTSSVPLVELSGATSRINFVTWADEAVIANVTGYSNNSGTGFGWAVLTSDGIANLVSDYTGHNSGGGLTAPVSNTGIVNFIEGFHDIRVAVQVSTGTSTYSLTITGTVKG